MNKPRMSKPRDFWLYGKHNNRTWSITRKSINENWSFEYEVIEKSAYDKAIECLKEYYKIEGMVLRTNTPNWPTSDYALATKCLIELGELDE